MTAFLGASVLAFLIFTVVLGGFAAMMTGNALAGHWRPAWHGVLYCLLLAGAARFMIWGVAGGDLLSVTGYLADAAVLIAVGQVAYRATRARNMVVQYPWLYERVGLLGWRDKGR